MNDQFELKFSGLAQLNILSGMDLSDPQPEMSDVNNDVTKMSAEHRSVTPGDFRAFPSENPLNFFKSSSMKKSPLSMSSSSPMLTEYGGEGRYMQQVTRKNGSLTFSCSISMPVHLHSTLEPLGIVVHLDV